MCHDVKGSFVSKNMIRESNQRCVVVHGTHNLTVSDNIAYDTHGHCYMTEDGGEIDNLFRRNLGALTQQATRLVRPVESDNFPSTFWCSNPQNTWIDNVAAGSKRNGFWFELQTEVRAPTALMPLSQGMNPRQLNLKLFQDNVAHSNEGAGLRVRGNGSLVGFQQIRFLTLFLSCPPFIEDISVWNDAPRCSRFQQHPLLQEQDWRCVLSQQSQSCS
jgi:hypothetical protein